MSITMYQSTREYLETRATQSGLSWEQVVGNEQEDTDPAAVVAVIFGGALDEEFCLWDTMYAVNVADWLAEQCAEESARQGGEDWEIIVSEYSYEDVGSVLYRISDTDES
jgi:hypothetical protein